MGPGLLAGPEKVIAWAPLNPVATLPNASLAVMVSLNAVPAVWVAGVVKVNVAALAGDTVKELELTVAVPDIPVIPFGVAVKVYEPAVLTTRSENVATPLLTVTGVVPEVKVPCALPDLMDIPIEPLADVATLPKLSRTCTATLGIAVPAIPGPGAAGLKAIDLAAPPVIVSTWVPFARAPEAVIVGAPALVSP